MARDISVSALKAADPSVLSFTLLRLPLCRDERVTSKNWHFVFTYHGVCSLWQQAFSTCFCCHEQASEGARILITGMVGAAHIMNREWTAAQKEMD